MEIYLLCLLTLVFFVVWVNGLLQARREISKICSKYRKLSSLKPGEKELTSFFILKKGAKFNSTSYKIADSKIQKYNTYLHNLENTHRKKLVLVLCSFLLVTYAVTEFFSAIIRFPFRETFHEVHSDSWEEKFQKFWLQYRENIPEFSRRVIREAVESIIERDKAGSDDVPSILLLVSSENNSHLNKNILLSLSAIISAAQHRQPPPLIEGGLDSKAIHEHFNQILGKEGHRCIMIDGIEKIPGKAAQSLHRYTDHQEAVFKNVAILLSAYTKKKLVKRELRLGEMDQIVTELLEVSWIKELPQDQLSPLITRLTPSVAIIFGSKD